MRIENINRVTENVVEVAFAEKNMTASILVERVEEDEMSFTLNSATFDGYKFTRKERTHGIIEFVGEVPQSIADKVQNFIDNIFYINACPMTKEDEKMYDQIMESFDQIEVTEEVISNTETINTTKTKVVEYATEETTKAYNTNQTEREVNSKKKPWLTMTGKVYDGKKARAIENFLEEVLLGKDEKYATQESLEKLLTDNNIEAHIDSYHIKQLNIGYEYIYIFDELEIPLTIGIDEYGKIEGAGARGRGGRRDR